VAHEQTPNWQPISFLPNLAEMVDGMLDRLVHNAYKIILKLVYMPIKNANNFFQLIAKNRAS
jgi:hypothetical protein